MTCPCGIEDWKCAQGDSCKESQSIHALTPADNFFFWSVLIAPTAMTVAVLWWVAA